MKGRAGIEGSRDSASGSVDKNFLSGFGTSRLKTLISSHRVECKQTLRERGLTNERRRDY